MQYGEWFGNRRMPRNAAYFCSRLKSYLSSMSFMMQCLFERTNERRMNKHNTTKHKKCIYE